METTELLRACEWVSLVRGGSWTGTCRVIEVTCYQMTAEKGVD